MALQEILREKEKALAGIRKGAEYGGLLESMASRALAAAPPGDFFAALSGTGLKIIAEVKKASPSKGIIRADFDPQALALAYERSGAAAISVLTEEKFFHGKLDYIRLVKDHVRVPVLRKDFILDELEVYESRMLGADAILLIAAILEPGHLADLIALTEDLSMTPLVEVHDRGELEAAVKAGARLIGINNRNLKTFKTNIATTRDLAPLVPEGRVIVSESGINTVEDIKTLMTSGVKAFLVGEALVREKDVGMKLRELLGAGRTD
ncbi:MAG: indole-3-glycerol phosphate synthase TrpC [Thermodesulfobacteriota bacterium]